MRLVPRVQTERTGFSSRRKHQLYQFTNQSLHVKAFGEMIWEPDLPLRFNSLELLHADTPVQV